MIQISQRERRRILVTNYTLGQNIDEGPDEATQFYVRLLPYADWYAFNEILKGSERCGTEAYSAMEHLLSEDPERHEDMAVEEMAFVNLDIPLVQECFSRQDWDLAERTNARLWYQIPLWKRCALVLREKNVWEMPQVDDDLGTVLELIKEERSRINTLVQARLRQARVG